MFARRLRGALATVGDLTREGEEYVCQKRSGNASLEEHLDGYL